MHFLSFRVPARFKNKALFQQAFFASWGRIPRLTQVDFHGDLLTLHPDMRGTGTMHLPVYHEKFGLVLCSTETLRQREKPYHLLKELCRGELGRLTRNLFEWKLYGFVPSQALHDMLRKSKHRFGILATGDESSESIDAESEELLYVLSDLSRIITEQYVDQIITMRRSRNRKIPVVLGVFANNGVLLESKFQDPSIRSGVQEAFRLAATTPSWRETEPYPGQFRWELVEKRLKIVEGLGMQNMIGPILSFDPGTLPFWVNDLIDDRESFESAALNYTLNFARRFRNRSKYWILSSRFFSCPDCGFSIGRGVSLICDLAHDLKREIGSASLIVGIDQPWGDYYRVNDCALPFVAIAETLASVESVDGFLLELNLGLGERNTLPRVPQQLGRMIDIWTTAEKQLFLSLSIPSETIFDQPRKEGFPHFTFQWTPETQMEWAVQTFLLCLTKRNVQGIFWNQLMDPDMNSPAESSAPYGQFPSFTSAGLIDAKGVPKPALYRLAALRKNLLE